MRQYSTYLFTIHFKKKNTQSNVTDVVLGLLFSTLDRATFSQDLYYLCITVNISLEMFLAKGLNNWFSSSILQVAHVSVKQIFDPLNIPEELRV